MPTNKSQKKTGDEPAHMRGGIAEYLCRACGYRYGNNHVPSCIEAASEIETSLPQQAGQGVPMHPQLIDLHFCDGLGQEGHPRVVTGQIGIADLVRFVPDSADSEENKP